MRVTKTDTTAEDAAQCLQILEAANEPVVAADLAVRLHLAGSRETQRRRVRSIVKHLRDECGAKIIATLQGGYFLTDDDSLWRDYLEGRQIDAKRILGTTHKQKREVLADRAGQGFLFTPNPAY